MCVWAEPPLADQSEQTGEGREDFYLFGDKLLSLWRLMGTLGNAGETLEAQIDSGKSNGFYFLEAVHCIIHLLVFSLQTLHCIMFYQSFLETNISFKCSLF